MVSARRKSCWDEESADGILGENVVSGRARAVSRGHNRAGGVLKPG